MKLWNKLRKRFLEVPYQNIHFFFVELFSCKTILVNYWIPPYSILGRYNFGDDLNLILIEKISKMKVIPYRYSILGKLGKKKNYLCIGSILNVLPNQQTEVWGSGVLSDQLSLPAKPVKVNAVRGPLTRQYLIRKGVDCPEVYGDPAILLPMYFKPRTTIKKFKLGVIPHYKDKDQPVVKEYEHSKDIQILDMINYGSCQEFIDRICSCEYIISSSLHGVIIADAYNIPNLWVEFSDKVQGAGFKFRDYFLSAKKEIDTPFQIISYIAPSIFIDQINLSWKPSSIDTKKLLDACPFYRK